MIIAINEKGEKIRASEKLPHASEGATYLCTYKWCPNRQMILRKGKHTIPHFAHKIGGGCDELSEIESERHLLIKDYIQSFLNINIDNVDYGEIEGVRPDIHYKDEFTLELQCSSISSEDICKRNEIYIRKNKIPVWLFDTDEFLQNDTKRRRLRVAERSALLPQGNLLYFTINKDEVDKDGFPEVKLFKYTYNSTKDFSHFRRNSSVEITTKEELNTIFAEIKSNWKSYESEVMSQGVYERNNLYKKDIDKKWKLWGKSMVCTEYKDGFGLCNKRFYTKPDQIQTRCKSCVFATILKKWNDIIPSTIVESIQILNRKLKIKGKIQTKEFINLDQYNAGKLMEHITKIDELKHIFNLNEKRYHELQSEYQNQLNRVYSRFIRINQTEFDFEITTLLREKKIKSHA